MKEKLIQRGAEAELVLTEYLGTKAVSKKRVVKGYRNKQLDEKIRSTRTKEEARLLHKTKGFGVKTPFVYKVDLKKNEILMEFIEGTRLKEALNKKNLRLCEKLGEQIGLMHSNGLIHGDLTTSNVFVQRGELVFIDFGLGYWSKSLEDKAVDLLNLKKMFKATHFSLWKEWKRIEKGYLKGGGKKEVLKKISQIEKRARCF
jgi:Kae1-associated kinase Bud32